MSEELKPCITLDDVRAVGGVVHKDGNIFLTSIDRLNAAVEAALRRTEATQAAQPVAQQEPTDVLTELTMLRAARYDETYGITATMRNDRIAELEKQLGVEPQKPAAQPVAQQEPNETRIRELMKQCGHEHSLSLYQAFKQFQMEMRLAYTAPAAQQGEAAAVVCHTAGRVWTRFLKEVSHGTKLYTHPAPVAQEVVDVLQEICDMQKRHYGDGSTTHIELIDLCVKARAALSRLTSKESTNGH